MERFVSTLQYITNHCYSNFKALHKNNWGGGGGEKQNIPNGK